MMNDILISQLTQNLVYVYMHYVLYICMYADKGKISINIYDIPNGYTTRQNMYTVGDVYLSN